ncbi:MAG TPA: transglutaminase-like domain-containing protein [Bellilinea sp.]|nr:transglutaminase-like domain-containing protein [Bellilinea sp.]
MNRRNNPTVRGYDVFGENYGVMLRNDVHDPRSIDHLLIQRCQLVDTISATSLYSKAPLISEKIEEHPLYVFARQFRKGSDLESLKALLRYTSGISRSFSCDDEDTIFGSTEQAILARGTDWCSDMARVGCVLSQCLGIPARIVYLADTSRAYSAHTAVEAYFNGGFAFCDFIYGVVGFIDDPISALKLQNNRSLVTECYQRDFPGYTKDRHFEDLFNAIAVSEYDPMADNDYTETRINEYYRKLLGSDHNFQWMTFNSTGKPL